MSAAQPVDPGTQDLSVAAALVATGRWEAARATLAPQLAAHPQDAGLLALMLRTQRGLGNTGTALDVAQALLAVTPNDPYALRLATLALLDRGWIDEAIGTAARAVSMDPLNARNHLALARAWADSPREEARSRHLQAATQACHLDPMNADAQVQFGAALAAVGDVQGARAAYGNALRLNPDNAAALNNLAVLDLQAGRPTGAARMLAASLRANPQDRVALRNLDAMVLSVVNRVGWWLLLAPVPALAAAAGGSPLLIALLVALALLGMPALVLRWWRALTEGQRRNVRGVRTRVRRRVWLWPGFTLIMGSSALCLASYLAATDGRLPTSALVSYLAFLTYVVALRLLGIAVRRGRVGFRERIRPLLDGRDASDGR